MTIHQKEESLAARTNFEKRVSRSRHLNAALREAYAEYVRIAPRVLKAEQTAKLLKQFA